MPRVVVELPRLKICKNVDCHEVATSFDGHCWNHSERRRLKAYSSRPRVSHGAKDPIGVELEMFNTNSIYKLTSVARYVCHDGSLPDGGGEIKLCSVSKRIADVAADTAQRARIAGAEVNHKCGFHVHMSLPSDFLRGSYYNLSDMYNRLAIFAMAVQDKFFDIMPPSRRCSGFCVKLEDNNNLSNHYSWLSLSSRVPTIELRIHGGTTNAWKVKAWVEFCIAFRQVIHDVIHGNVDAAEAAKVDSLADYCTPGSLASKYIKAREKSPSLANFGF